MESGFNITNALGTSMVKEIVVMHHILKEYKETPKQTHKLPTLMAFK